MSLHQRLSDPIRLTPGAPVLFLVREDVQASAGILGLPRPGVRISARHTLAASAPARNAAAQPQPRQA